MTKSFASANDLRRLFALAVALCCGVGGEVRAQMIELGANPKAITSPFDGTALIAAAHLGHVEVVAVLIAAKTRSITRTISGGPRRSRP